MKVGSLKKDDKFPVKLIKKRKRLQVINAGNQKRAITTNPTDIKKMSEFWKIFILS